MKDAACLQHVARRIAAAYHQGKQLVVVVSAQGKTTDHLAEKAKEITAAPSGREMDVLLSSGEQMSISLLAMALQDLGCPALSFCGWQVGIHTDLKHQNARILRVDTEKIQQQLKEGNIVVVAGFQGINEAGEITTLGRGGSDTTAVALAAALKADCCQIFTDVDGVYTADPNWVPQARKWKEISYQDMLTMASMGAKVLHDRAVELAKEQQVKLEVLSTFSEDEGTCICQSSEKSVWKGLTAEMETLRYFLPAISLENAGRLMLALRQKGVRPDLCHQPKKEQLSFTVFAKEAEEVEEQLQALNLSAQRDGNWAKISLVGSGLNQSPNLKQQLNDALEREHIVYEFPWLGEQRYTVLVAKTQAQAAICCLHSLLLCHWPEHEN